MLQDKLHLLDNPVWHALQGTHSVFAQGTPTVMRYAPHVLPFVGYAPSATDPLQDILPWITPAQPVYIVGELPPLPPSWSVLAKLECTQMVCSKPPAPPATTAAEVQLLSEEDNKELVELINLVQPGFFESGTPLLGNYYGVRDGGRLVAMAGERLKMPGLTEVSAVGTHPDFTGRGLARQLVQHVCSRIYERGETPFLHVLSTNKRAIGLYEWLGFRKRRDMPFWKVLYEKGS